MGFRHRLFVFLEWVLCFVTHGREARLITAQGEGERLTQTPP
jgi:hypothetical protein